VAAADTLVTLSALRRDARRLDAPKLKTGSIEFFLKEFLRTSGRFDRYKTGPNPKVTRQIARVIYLEKALQGAQDILERYQRLKASEGSSASRSMARFQASQFSRRRRMRSRASKPAPVREYWYPY